MKELTGVVLGAMTVIGLTTLPAQAAQSCSPVAPRAVAPSDPCDSTEPEAVIMCATQSWSHNRLGTPTL